MVIGQLVKAIDTQITETKLATQACSIGAVIVPCLTRALRATLKENIESMGGM